MRKRHSGFTLVEILVVLAVGTIVTAITFSGFNSIREGNKRTNCQSNLAQIYQASRLYSQDNEKFPYYNPGVATGANTPSGGLGLWALYGFPNIVDENGDGVFNDPARTDNDTPVGTYIRNLSGLHCPSDSYKRADNANSIMSNLPYKADNVLNTDYLSYQVNDDVPGAIPTYSSFRGGAQKRQLDYYTVIAGTATRSTRPMDDTTVVTWCRFHRKLTNTGATGSSGRNYDNVLFGDGSVQLLPVSQNVSFVNPSTGAETATGTCTGWNRVPRSMAETLPNNNPKFNCP